MMNDRYTGNVTNLDYENVSENDSINILDDQFKNCMEILIAQCIGAIPKNYSIEYQRLSAYAYYPPLNAQQLHKLAIENITSNEIERRINEEVYKQLEFSFEKTMIHWNSIVQTTAKRYVSNSVEKAVETIRRALIENTNQENQNTNIIVQRFILDNNQLKLV
ncbi:unnamed protein product [Adineta steineri]|uniref:Uncharacterized protein n=1 Tax=Adineta steineri TaxID=433720 RepID=A0A814B284_9BILA|nr:unnamed protein product [Adineta steineri]CAF4060153.1 unnamed protein product [Adineta steineri]